MILRTEIKLALLWTFLTLNYLYCDLLSLMDSELLKQYLTGEVNGIVMDKTFLFAAAVLMEVPMAAVLISLIFKSKVVKIYGLAASSFMFAVQVATLLMDESTIYYWFFSIIELSTTAFIFLTALKWRIPKTEAEKV